MRFYCGGNKLLYIPQTDTVSNSAGEEFTELTNNFITSQVDFIKKLKDLHRKKLLSIVSIYRSDDGESFLFTNKQILNSQRYRKAESEYLFIYKPEKEYLSLVNKILNLDDIRTFRYFIRSMDNDYNVVAPWEIYDLLFTAEKLKLEGKPYFTQFKKKCKNGKIRDIVAPDDELKEKLQQLNLVLQRLYDKKNIDFQVAYKKGKNIVSNAAIHRNNNFVFNIDLHDFFPSCKRELVKKYINVLFGNSCFNSEIEEYFLDIILLNDGLFIGSPISGTIANAILSKPAAYLKNICKKCGMEFSLYADDMTFSSNKFISQEFILEIFNTAMYRYGLDKYFTLNDKKSIGFSSNNRKVTGVSINNKNQLTVNNGYYRDLRVKIHKLSIGETMSNAKLQKLRGKIAYALMVDESGKFFKYIQKFKTTAETYNLISKKKYEQLEEKFK